MAYVIVVHAHLYSVPFNFSKLSWCIRSTFAYQNDRQTVMGERLRLAYLKEWRTTKKKSFSATNESRERRVLRSHQEVVDPTFWRLE